VHLVSANFDPIPKDLGSFLRSHSMGGKFLDIELEGIAPGIKWVPADHDLLLKTAAN